MTTSPKPTKDEALTQIESKLQASLVTNKVQTEIMALIREALAQPAADDKAVESENEYFAKRPQIDCNDRRMVFRAGFSAGRAADDKAGGAVGEVRRVGMASYGRPWHEIYWYDKDVDVPHGTKLYTRPQPQADQPAEQCRREPSGPNEYVCDCKPGSTPFYVIVGRIPGDDEDTALSVGQHATDAEAYAAFDRQMREINRLTDEEAAAIQEEFVTGDDRVTYVIHTIRSDYPMEVL